MIIKLQLSNSFFFSLKRIPRKKNPNKQNVKKINNNIKKPTKQTKPEEKIDILQVTEKY